MDTWSEKVQQAKRLVSECERLFNAVHPEFIQARQCDPVRFARLDAIEKRLIARLERRIGALKALEAQP